MRNHFLRLRGVITAFLLPFSLFSYSQPSRLHAEAARIVNADNVDVLLKGVGLGSWMIQEGYMLKPDYTGSGTQWSMKQRLYNQGQTDAQVEAFYQSWRNNFITKADIDYIASLGFNCVRLPMHYELFLTSDQRAVRNSVIHNSGNYTNYVNSLTTWYNNNQLFNSAGLEGFRLVDSLLKWTASNNMYVILDLHAAPGSQGTDTNIADALRASDLWNNSIYRDITVRLWQTLSSHYAANDGVAFYDLINEPNNVPANQTIHDMFERLINAIRAQGDNHLLMIEGNGWGNNYNYMEPFTFTNPAGLVYNAHRYGNSTSTTATSGDPNQISELGNLTAFRSRYNVPVWVGETGENNDSWLSANIAAINSVGIGWAHWTYKRFDYGENPALMHLNQPFLMDGAGNMPSVLNNIKFVNGVKNNGTISAVAPGKAPASLAPIGATVTFKGFNNKFVNSALLCTDSSVSDTDKFLIVDGGNGKIALKHAGKFISSENNTQAMTCNRTVAQDWEKFTWVVNADGTVSLQGSNGLYVSSENGTKAMTCSRATAQGWEDFTVAIVQGPPPPPPPVSTIPIGKTIWLQGNNSQYVSSKNGVGPMYCNATTLQSWNQFFVGDAGNGKVTLSNLGKFVTSNNGDSAMTCNRATADDWETFTWISNTDGTISLQGNNGLYVTSNNGDSAMACNRATIQGWEEFNFGVVVSATAAGAKTVAVTAEMMDAGSIGGVYPNPVKAGQGLMVDLPQLAAGQPVLVSVTDASGRTVLVRQATTGVFTIPTTGLVRGVYFVKISQGVSHFVKTINVY